MEQSIAMNNENEWNTTTHNLINLSNRTWMNLASTMWYKRSQAQKGTFCFIPLMYNSKTDNPNYGIGSQDKGYPWGTEIGD